MVEPAENEFLAGLEAKSKARSPFFRAMAHRPEVLQNFVPLYGAVMGRGSVERRVKELVYLTCSYANECAYCTAAHVAGGRKAGITEEEMQALQTEQDHGFGEAERAAIRYARELTQKRRRTRAGRSCSSISTTSRWWRSRWWRRWRISRTGSITGSGIMPEE